MWIREHLMKLCRKIRFHLLVLVDLPHLLQVERKVSIGVVNNSRCPTTAAAATGHFTDFSNLRRSARKERAYISMQGREIMHQAIGWSISNYFKAHHLNTLKLQPVPPSKVLSSTIILSWIRSQRVRMRGSRISGVIWTWQRHGYVKSSIRLQYFKRHSKVCLGGRPLVNRISDGVM